MTFLQDLYVQKYQQYNEIKNPIRKSILKWELRQIIKKMSQPEKDAIAEMITEDFIKGDLK